MNKIPCATHSSDNAELLSYDADFEHEEDQSTTPAIFEVEDPHIAPTSPQDSSVRKLSIVEALANTLKAYVGSGVLTLPFAFMCSGIWVGVAIFPLLALLSGHCMFLLVDCKRALKHERVTLFSEVAYHAYGRVGSTLLNMALVSSQAGFCCAYVIFLAKNFGLLFPNLSFAACTFIVAVPIFLLCYLKTLKYLSPFSMIANFLIILGLCLIFSYSIPEAIHTT